MNEGTALLLEADSVRKTYRLGRTRMEVLRGATISVSEGEWVAVLGASGSGKSTLLHLLGGLDRPDRADGGRVRFSGDELAGMRASALDRYRARDVGFVFQAFHLLPELTALENVLLAAMTLHGRLGFMRRRGQLRERAATLLDRVGLGDRMRHRPVELSGGERQRVSIARAVMNSPRVLLADEPTGNLDHETGAIVLDAIERLREESSMATVLVTHDREVAARADRTVRLYDGRVMGADEATVG